MTANIVSVITEMSENIIIFFFKSKYDNLLLYNNRLNEFKNLVPRTKKNKN